MNPVFFYIFAGLALGCSLFVVFNRNPVASAFSLVLVFFAFAGLYAMMDAHLIAALQILVYAGAIMVLFVFVIMLLNAATPVFDLSRSHRGMQALIGILTVGLLCLFVWAFKNSPNLATPGPFNAQAIEAGGGNTRVVSELMFSEFILPFELTSLLLLAGIVGAVAMAKRKQGGAR